MTTYRRAFTLAPNAAARFDLDELHKAVSRSVPANVSDTHRADHNLLFATARSVPRRFADRHVLGLAHTVLVQADVQPCETDVLTATGNAFEVTTRFASGTPLRLQAIFNPTKRIGRETNKRRPITKPASVQEWFERKIANAATLNGDVSVGLPQESVGIKRFTFINLFAQIIVDDADSFETLMCTGIGQARAYGAGMLMVAAAA